MITPGVCISLLEGADNTPAGGWGGTEVFKEIFPDGYIIALDNGTVKVRKDHKWITVPVKDLCRVFKEEFGLEIPDYNGFIYCPNKPDLRSDEERRYERAMGVIDK